MNHLNEQYQILLEHLDVLFSELMHPVMSEQGMLDELDFEPDMYLESFSDEEKIEYINKILG